MDMDMIVVIVSEWGCGYGRESLGDNGNRKKDKLNLKRKKSYEKLP